jgi:hypothetical protein
MKTPSELAADYLALWNERDAGRRLERLAMQWTAEARYVDPLASVAGRDAISGLIGAVQAQFPDFRFRSLGAADGHADYVRFSWGLGPENGEALAKGTDFVRCEGGRIASVTGFLDLVPGQAS